METTPQDLIHEAAALHFRVEVINHDEQRGRKPRPDGWVITVEGAFAPGNAEEYRAAEGAAKGLLRMVPMTYPGSVWGTDSASVGGHAGLTGGYMRLSKSGVSARFAKAVRKAQEGV